MTIIYRIESLVKSDIRPKGLWVDITSWALELFPELLESEQEALSDYLVGATQEEFGLPGFLHLESARYLFGVIRRTMPDLELSLVAQHVSARTYLLCPDMQDELGRLAKESK